MHCHICGKSLPDDAKNCSNCGANVSGTSTQAVSKPSPSDYPMKWYYFMVHGMLLVGAILSIISAIPYLFDQAFLFSFVIIACSIFALIVRHTLLRFKASAPTVLLIYLIVDAIFGIGSFIREYLLLTPQEAAGLVGTIYIASAVIMVILDVIKIACNTVYFHKRKELFTE